MNTAGIPLPALLICPLPSAREAHSRILGCMVSGGKQAPSRYPGHPRHLMMSLVTGGSSSTKTTDLAVMVPCGGNWDPLGKGQFLDHESTVSRG